MKLGFKSNEILYETAYGGSRPDVLAESKDRAIVVECRSCYIHKIKSYLEEETQEVWVITSGVPPWDKDPLSMQITKSKVQWFIFRRGPNWEKYLEAYKKKQLENLKKTKSIYDIITEERKNEASHT